MVKGHSKHGEKSYHFTTKRLPNGMMSYARIKWDDCIHEYTMGWGASRVMNVVIFDLDGNIVAWGDEMDLVNGSCKKNGATKSEAIANIKAMPEYHLNDDYPLWTPSGWTLDPSIAGFDDLAEEHPTRKQKGE
jgi:hypothetical protein